MRTHAGDADRTLRWGVLSTAKIATEKVIPGLRRSARNEVVAIASRSAEGAEAAARALEIPRAHPSYEALLADPAVEAVYVPLPNHLHAEWTIAAARAGKHVLCEKPLAMTSEESAELVKLAASSGLVNCTNFNIRFYPIVQEARERVRAGELGDVWNVHGGYLQDWLATPEDWNWRLEPARGGDLRAVGDIGSHWMDLAQFVTGSRIVEVFADLATTIPVRRRPVGV